MARHNPRCNYLQEPPTLRDPNDCNCGAIPSLPRAGGVPRAEDELEQWRQAKKVEEANLEAGRLQYDRFIKGELLPLRGIRLWRWRLACRIFQFGCWVGGRHRQTLEYNKDWHELYCPHCGWMPDE